MFKKAITSAIQYSDNVIQTMRRIETPIFATALLARGWNHRKPSHFDKSRIKIIKNQNKLVRNEFFLGRYILFS